MLLTNLTNWLLAYKYIVLFPGVVIEGPILTVIAGFLASSGHLNLFIAYGVIVIADITGDSLYYFLGRFGGTRFIERWGSKVGLTLERVEKIENHYAEHAGKTLILGKFAHSIEIPFLVAAGLAGVPYGTFLWYVFIPTVPKSLLFILIGYYFGRAYGEINNYLGYTALIMSAAALALIAVYFILKKISARYEK